jgi:hypothetical protein
MASPDDSFHPSTARRNFMASGKCPRAMRVPSW